MVSLVLVHTNQIPCIFTPGDCNFNVIGKLSNQEKLQNNGGKIRTVAGDVKGWASL